MTSIFLRKEWKHGLRCMICNHRFEEGEAISKQLVAVHEDSVVVELTCSLCSIEAALTA